MTVDPIENHCEEEVFVFPVSFAQQRLWFFDQLVPNSCLYNVPTLLRLTGTLDRAALAQSFNEIVRRHEVLRTTFVVVEGQLVQLIVPQLSLPLPLLDLQTVPLAQQPVQQLILQEIRQPFNLSQGPLLRLKLLRLEADHHVLILNLHHIVFDEWSVGVLIREVGTLYAALKEGKPSPLQPLPIQYADFAQWQRQWLQGEVLRTQLSYWQQQLNDLASLNLPSDRPRRSQPSHQGAIQRLELPEELSVELERLSQQSGTTLFMTLLAAFQTLLYRYTGQADIAVGSPIANRNRSELEALIGFFTNSLVLRTDLSGNPSFRELLARVRETTLAAYAYQDLPFEKLVEELHPDRDPSRHPLFQVVFALQNAPMEHLTLPGLTLSSLDLEVTTTRFDLELYLWESGENFRSLWGSGWQQSTGLRGVLVYSTDLFDRGSMVRLLTHFQTLLTAAVAAPDTRLGDLPVLSAAEEAQLLQEWNQTQRPYPREQCIQQRFEAQVDQQPEAIAVRFGDQSFTYEALNRGSNQLAHYLRRRGVGPESLVGVCLDPSVMMVAGLLGILKAGGAYLPLDPACPPDRLRWMLADAGVSLLLTQQPWVDPLGALPMPVICLERDWPAIAEESEENPAPRTTAANLAYVIYTSGSTGTPKGVAVPHRAVARLVCNSNYVQLQPTDSVAQAANLAFDAATFEIWGALLNGAQLVGIPRELLLAPPAFAAQLRQQGITVLFLTTALFNQLVREVPAAFGCLRYLLFGGEAVDPTTVARVQQHGGPQHLLHVYGPTENTTFTTWYPVESQAEAIPIGRAIANTQLYLLDAALQPVPIGVTGEIYIGGEGLARGYLNRPELTAERFIPHPFSPEPGARLYKTGDLACYQADGNLEFLGRLDDQVKLRGFRIELGEIEAALNQHPGVQTVRVILREDGLASTAAENRRLVAYLVPQANRRLSAQELRSFLKTKLPDYMLPAAFVVLEQLPLTANGKVDRRALPPPDWLPAEQPSSTPQPPRTSLEEELSETWAEVLGRQPPGINDNFFELGGHSLLATQLISRIRDRYGVEVPLRQFFETPTIVGLATYLNAQPAISKAVPDGGGSPLLSREEVEF